MSGKGDSDETARQSASPSSADNCGQEADDAASDATTGLTARQEQAIEALLHEPSIARAATSVGVNERTLRRWLTDADFRAALQRARRDAFGQAIGLTHRYAPVAVATLVKVMNDSAASPSARVTAAGVLLKFGREGIELDDLAERIERLEQAVKGASPAGAIPAGAVGEDE